MTRADGEDIALADVPSPPKMLRLGSMVKNLLDEVHAMPLDERGRERLFEIHQRAVTELNNSLSEPLKREFTTLAPHLRAGDVVSDAELRVAQAQLLGWLQGLFEGMSFAAALHQAEAARRR